MAPGEAVGKTREKGADRRCQHSGGRWGRRTLAGPTASNPVVSITRPGSAQCETCFTFLLD
jgi:hypothetical protein